MFKNGKWKICEIVFIFPQWEWEQGHSAYSNFQLELTGWLGSVSHSCLTILAIYSWQRSFKRHSYMVVIVVLLYTNCFYYFNGMTQGVWSIIASGHCFVGMKIVYFYNFCYFKDYPLTCHVFFTKLWTFQSLPFLCSAASILNICRLSWVY